jgi:hypothetical protein
MSTWYLGLTPLNEPFDLGPDESGRVQFSCNFVALKRPSLTFVQEVLAVLEAAGVGTRAVDLFGSSQVAIPGSDVDGPFLTVRSTGGMAPEGTHNAGAGAYRRPGLQVIAHARDASAAEAMAQAAFGALLALRNQAVVA